MTTDGLHFLTVLEGADHLGVSTLKLREAAMLGLVPSQRDNEGRLRVDLTGLTTLPPKRRQALAADVMLGMFFDEIEDLHDALARKTGEVTELGDLGARQGDALTRAGQALPDGPSGREAELTGLLDRAMKILEMQGSADGDTDRLRASTDKAMDLLDRAMQRGDAIEAELGATRTQLDQALSLSERAVEQAARTRTERPGFWARIFGR